MMTPVYADIDQRAVEGTCGKANDVTTAIGVTIRYLPNVLNKPPGRPLRPAFGAVSPLQRLTR